jgi:hypothetical protein
MTDPVHKFATREEWLNAFVTYARPEFLAQGYTLPDRIRVSVGFTSSGSRGKRIGECWADSASEDGYFEIFLKPTMNNDSRMADVLTHELVHAAVGIPAGHGKAFKDCARAMGLTGPATSTSAGTEWYRWALPVLAELGAMPYGKLSDGISTASPKQKTNLRKVSCPRCGWLARVTTRHIEPHSHLACPVPSCGGELVAE